MTPRTAACQASLSINSQSLLKFMFITSVMPSNHLILCHPLLLLPSIFPSIRISSNELVLRIRWLKYGVSVGSISLLQQIFPPTGFLHCWQILYQLSYKGIHLHCRQILYQLSHKGSQFPIVQFFISTS